MVTFRLKKIGIDVEVKSEQETEESLVEAVDSKKEEVKKESVEKKDPQKIVEKKKVDKKETPKEKK